MTDSAPINQRVWTKHLWLHAMQFPDDQINEALEELYELGATLVDIKFQVNPIDPDNDDEHGNYGQVLILYRYPRATE